MASAPRCRTSPIRRPAHRRPGLIVAQLHAWGWSGTWSEGCGFDGFVQPCSASAMIEAPADRRSGVLPAQALDHGTGHLLAAAVLLALGARHATGGGQHLRLSLAGSVSCLHALPPPVHYEGAPANWNRGPSGWDTDLSSWG
ncbi:CoA transferase [Streptomyces sp. x-45]|uniref:CoA transferase n=1 Tax=Streptomyces sp. x-45 TaxID=2789281 RepID=UPI00397EAD36